MPSYEANDRSGLFWSKPKPDTDEGCPLFSVDDRWVHPNSNHINLIPDIVTIISLTRKDAHHMLSPYSNEFLSQEKGAKP